MAYRWTHCESLALLSALDPYSIPGKDTSIIGILYQIDVVAVGEIKYASKVRTSYIGNFALALLPLGGKRNRHLGFLNAPSSHQEAIRLSTLLVVMS